MTENKTVDTAGSLLNFEPFGSPKRKLDSRAKELKRLKEDIILYRALDATEWQKQDRRTWRRPQTFSMGQAERVTKLSAADQARAVMDGASELDFQADLGGGPRGILKALNAATSTPFVPASEREKEKEREQLAASLGQHTMTQQQQDDKDDEEKRNKSVAAATAAAGGDVTAHIISEVELRQVRKQFKEMVRKQREAESQAQSDMYLDVRRAMESEKGHHHHHRDGHQQEIDAIRGGKRKMTTTPRSFALGTTTPSYAAPKSARASSARTHRTAAASATAAVVEDGNDDVGAKTKKGPASTTTRATTSLAELAHASTSGEARQPKFFSVEPPKTPSGGASRARVYQFNAYKSNGIMGMQRALSASPRARGPSSAAATANENDDTRSQDSNNTSEQCRRDLAAKQQNVTLTPRGGVSSHPSLPPDAATRMFHRAHEVDVELEQREKEIERRQQEAASVRRATDPVIEVNDPFRFLVDGAAAIHSGSQNQAAASRREYTLSLQEKLLSLAASHAGVSLHAAAAPGRVLGVRPPTAEAQEAHHRRNQPRAASARGAKSAASLDDSLFSSNDQMMDNSMALSSAPATARATALGGKRVVSSVTNLNASLGSSVALNATTTGSAAGSQQREQQQQQQQMSASAHASKKQDERFCNSAPLPFGRAGPIERHIPSVRIHAPTNERQQRSLCENVHAASRTPSCASYRPQSQQFSRPTWQTVRTMRAAAHMGLAAPVMTWNV